MNPRSNFNDCVSFIEAIENVCFLINLKKAFLQNRKYRRIIKFCQKIKNLVGSFFVVILIAAKIRFGWLSFSEDFNQAQNLVQNNFNQVSRVVPNSIYSNHSLIMQATE